MKKAIVVVFLVVLALAVTFEMPSSITTFAIKLTSTLVSIARQVLKTVLTAIANML